LIKIDKKFEINDFHWIILNPIVFEITD